MTTSKRVTLILVLTMLALAGLGGWLFFKFGYVYSEGTDTGELNYFSYEGVVFKTYEGKVIQTGVKKAANSNAAIQSNEFRFSVTDQAIADSLMHSTGRMVTLHYKRYNATLPWRGNSVYVVDSIWSVK